MAESIKRDDKEMLATIFYTSDEYHDITCTPCSKDNRNAAASKYCVECVSFLCDKCLTQHNRFGAMKTHSIVDKEQAKQNASDQSLELPEQKCEKHHGKRLDMYCKIHEEVCCAVCAAFDHSGCKEKVYLPNQIGQFKGDANDIENICRSLNESQAKMESLKLARMKSYEKFECQKKTIIAEIRSIRKRVDNHFDRLEDKMKSDVEKENIIFKGVTDVDIKKTEKVLLALKDQRKTIQELSARGNTVSLFVQTTLAKKNIQEAEKLEKEIESPSTKNVYFVPNKNLNALLDFSPLGTIMNNIPECTAELYKIVSVKTSNEKSVPTYSGICSLEDGSTLICDWENKILLRLDENYNITEQLDLPGHPYSICSIDSLTAAVTLTKERKVVFLTTENQVELTSSFETGAECRGIAYADGRIYIACGGWTVFNEGPGHIKVCSTSGKLLYFWRDDCFTQLGHVDIAGSRLYVADNNNGLIIMDHEGVVQTIFSHKDMCNPHAVCAGLGNQLFLGGWSSHNVMLLNDKGQLLRMFLTQKNGIKDIHTVYFDKTRARFIYTMRDTYKIKIYDLTYQV